MQRTPEHPSLPDKLSFKIGEVSELVGVKPHVLRYWEKEFGRVRPQKTANGHRIYSKNDVQLLRRLQRLLHERGYTIAGARALLREGEGAVDAALASRPGEAAIQLDEVSGRIDALERALKSAQYAQSVAEKEVAHLRDETVFWKGTAQSAEARLKALVRDVRVQAKALLKV